MFPYHRSGFVDPSKSKKLGWEPKYDLAGLVKEMVASDLEILKRLG